MGKILIPGSSGGGVSSDDVTAGKAQVLQGYKTVTNDSDDEIVEGAIPNRGNVVDTVSFENAHWESKFVARMEEGYYSQAGQWKPCVAIPYAVLAGGIGVDAGKMLDTLTISGVRGTIPVRGYHGPDSSEMRLYLQEGGYVVRIEEGYYHKGGQWKPYVIVPTSLAKSAVNYRPEKTLDDTVTCDERGQIPVKPNENMTIEIVNISWTNPKKIGFRFPQGYYPNSGQYAPIVEVNYQDLANAIGIRADKMMNDTNVLGIQGNLPYWVCYTGDVISALNNEGFAWDDTYAGRGRGIVVKIPNSHVIAGANYVFLSSPNLYPQNIRAGVNLHGVTGTMVDYGAGGQAFRAATFDGRLLTGVANKGFILNGIGRYLNLKSGTGGYVGIQDGGLKLYNGYGGNTRFKTASDVGCVFANSVNLTPFRYIKIGFKFIEFRGDGTGAQPARIELEVGATPINGAGGETYHNESNTVVRDVGGRSKFAIYTMTSTRVNVGNISDQSQQYLTLDVSASQGHHFIYIMLGNIVHEYSGGSVYAVVVVNNIEFIN